ncbi:TaqI-like C-terminal specificity domain-containing protein [Myroides odoratimimus]|uniref:TaqI-like C-terminal specificity domain-containing protein n=1 Tax=Myroides odoratimimus TaxID=76832 RepID=UPI0025768432|nr:TaqI-like C-terminal specificity domain-containing protein [Myroides odoratimimus]
MSSIEKQIKDKIEAIGTPLKEWDININYGIKTGFNEAFIITGEKRKELIDEDPKSAEIIRPLLRGRDIKRYSYELTDLYLITTFPSLKIDIEKYPAVKEHLMSFGYDRLKQTGDKGSRKKTNNEWFETQDTIAYWEDFYRQKIAWNRIASEKKFAIIDEDIVIQDSMHFFCGKQLEYLCAVLNSKLIEWILRLNIGNAAGGNAGNSDNIKDLKIPHILDKQLEQDIINLLKNKDRKEIDRIVYNLYELNNQEIEFIELP